MRTLPFNTGLMFERPYESDYIKLRRYLCVNPGLTYDRIIKALRSSLPRYASPHERLMALSPPPPAAAIISAHDRQSSFRRQCPACANELYHSDIYAYDWLGQCPIHHCDFTTHCPACGQPWPELVEIEQRNCPVCGPIAFGRLVETVLPAVKQERYQPIVALYQFSSYESDSSSVTLWDPDDFRSDWASWPTEVHIRSSHFPSFQVRRYTQFKAPQLDTWGVHVQRVNVLSTRVHPVEGSTTRASSARRRRPRDDFYVMRQIVEWIARHAGRNHELNIDTYHHSRISDFVDGPLPCPYCLAFSLWFFHIAAKYYGNGLAVNLSDYPFCREGGLVQLFNSFEPEVVVGTNRYKPDPPFIRWFYRRGLEISFLDVLRFAFDLVSRINAFGKESAGVGGRLDVTNFSAREFPDRLYAAHVKDGRLSYYFLNKFPLAAYTPPSLKRSTAICRAYQADYEQRPMVNFRRRYATIYADDIGMNEYRELLDYFPHFAARITGEHTARWSEAG